MSACYGLAHWIKIEEMSSGKRVQKFSTVPRFLVLPASVRFRKFAPSYSSRVDQLRVDRLRPRADA